MQVLELGQLLATVTRPLPDAGAPDPSPLTVVLLHGYGAPATDLVGLEGALSLPPGARFVFPAAPRLLEPRLGARSGRAWWPIDMVELQTAVATSRLDLLRQMRPPGLDEARAALGTLLAALQEAGVPPERTVLGGFSQGAMLALDYALREQPAFAGLVLLSGTIVSEAEWLPLIAASRPYAVFQSHSPDDFVLPFPTAAELARLLDGSPMGHEFVKFRGGHGIGPSVLEGLGAFLSRLSAASRPPGA